MTSRRSIAERVIARATSRGMPIDGDVECMAIIELWVSGDIEAGEMRDRFNALLARRSRSKRGLGPSPGISPKMSQAAFVQVDDGPADEVPD